MGEDGFEIRAVSAEDAEELAALMRGLHAHLKEPTGHISPEKLTRDVLCVGSAHSVLVAERGGALLGYALFHETYESIYAQRGVYLADLFVAEEARRNGTGRALVAAVAHRARERDLRFIWWVSEAWDEDAQGFYAALGASHDPMIAHSLSYESFNTLADEGKKKSSRA
jgi:GNAT superfamily N-acetyltransferase